MSCCPICTVLGSVVCTLHYKTYRTANESTMNVGNCCVHKLHKSEKVWFSHRAKSADLLPCVV